jgi:serine protease Do
MFNLKGEVVGIITQVNTHPHQSLGFAIPTNIAKTLLLERRSMWMGFSGYWVSGGLAMALNLPQSAGLLIQRIASHSPASRLRLQAGTVAAIVGSQKFVIGGDIILSMQGISLAEADGYERARKELARMANGETLHLRILRAGRQMDLAVPLAR